MSYDPATHEPVYSSVRHIDTMAATIRPCVDRIAGLDGEYLSYLVDRATERNGADTDEYRALEAFYREAKSLPCPRHGGAACDC